MVHIDVHGTIDEMGILRRCNLPKAWLRHRRWPWMVGFLLSRNWQPANSGSEWLWHIWITLLNVHRYTKQIASSCASHRVLTVRRWLFDFITGTLLSCQSRWRCHYYRLLSLLMMWHATVVCFTRLSQMLDNISAFFFPIEMCSEHTTY